jgi:hypothetical protein
MTAIILVSCYHLFMGIAVLLVPRMPEPFGQLDPFRNGLGMTYPQIGWMLIIISTMALSGLTIGRFWYIQQPNLRFARRASFIAPQQILITFSAYQGFLALLDSIQTVGWLDPDVTSARLLFALNVSLWFAIWHFIGVVIWMGSTPLWRTAGCLTPLCPYRQFFNITVRGEKHQHDVK